MQRYLLNAARAGARDDLRACKRDPVYTEAAVVSAPELAADVTCAVRDISEQGARLEIERELRRRSNCATLPEQVSVFFGPRQAQALCRVMWQDGAHFGVSFLEPLQKPGAKPGTVPESAAMAVSEPASRPLVAACRNYVESEDD